MSTYIPAYEMLRRLRARELSAGELLEEHLERIERCNAALNAVVIRDDGQARRAAQEADDRRARGEDAALLGLPFTVKDWIEAGGWRSTAGDPGMKDYVAQQDCRVVERLRRADAVLAVYPAVATLCGQPATALPASFSQAGLPIGLQAVGPYLEDRTPIRFAALVAREFGGFTPQKF